MDDERRQQAIDLLVATHQFPCPFTIKIIGRTENAFSDRIVAALRAVLELDLETDLPLRTRHTPNGRHVAITVEPVVQSASDVLDIYASIRQVEGIVMLM